MLLPSHRDTKKSGERRNPHFLTHALTQMNARHDCFTSAATGSRRCSALNSGIPQAEIETNNQRRLSRQRATQKEQNMDRKQQPEHTTAGLCLVIALVAGCGSSDDEPLSESGDEGVSSGSTDNALLSESSGDATLSESSVDSLSNRSSHTATPPVGLGLYFANGVHSPDLNPAAPADLHIIDGYPRYMQELYIIATAPTTPEDGLAPLTANGDMSQLDWTGVTPVHEDWRLEANGVTWAHTVNYKHAKWMDDYSAFFVQPVNVEGHPVGLPLVMNAGVNEEWKILDTMFERRLVARVVQLGCQAEGDCSNSSAITYAEGLVQLRQNMYPALTSVAIPESAAQLKLYWTQDLDEGVVRSVNVVHDPPGEIAYGFNIQLTPTNLPERGYYLPGERALFQVTYIDGAGTPLFAAGTVPSYGDILFRNDAAQGMRAITFTDHPMLYWAHKALQADAEFSFAGPIDKMTTVGTTPISPDPSQPNNTLSPQIQLADVAHDGWTSFTQILPPTTLVFPCLFALGDLPGGDFSKCWEQSPDVFGIDIPAEAQPGTYSVQIKTRREWKGEPKNAATSIRVQVGTSTATTFPGFTIPDMNNNCGQCHVANARIDRALHGFPGLNKVGPECVSCHTRGFYFEPDADIVTRLQRMHEFTDRLGPPRL